MAASRLALAIPTYHRAQVLADTLRGLAPALRELGIAVHVLDDSSNEDTAQALEGLQQQEALDVVYRHNRPSLRHDRNLIAALQSPDAEHVWLLGDGALVREAGLRRVHAALHGQDFVFLNCRNDEPGPSFDVPAGTLREHLAAQSWALTYTGATVYSRRVVEWWRGRPGVVMRNFPQLSVVLGFAAAHADAGATVVGERILWAHPQRSSSYWLADAVSVWGVDWHAVVSGNAGAFPARALPAVLQSHARHTGILSAKHLIALRAIGRYSPAVWAESAGTLPACCTVPGWALRTIARLPQGVASTMLRARPSWRRRYLPQSAVA
jgi:abequosyltransferase